MSALRSFLEEKPLNGASYLDASTVQGTINSRTRIDLGIGPR